MLLLYYTDSVSVLGFQIAYNFSYSGYCTNTLKIWNVHICLHSKKPLHAKPCLKFHRKYVYMNV